MRFDFRCRECGGELLPIIYGLPDGGLMAAAEAGTVVLGSCVIGDDDPTHECASCRRPEWVAGDATVTTTVADDGGWDGFGASLLELIVQLLGAPGQARDWEGDGPTHISGRTYVVIDAGPFYVQLHLAPGVEAYGEVMGPANMARMGASVRAERMARLADDWQAPDGTCANWHRWFDLRSPTEIAGAVVSVLRYVFEISEQDEIEIQVFSP
jgi:hypothetical protein